MARRRLGEMLNEVRLFQRKEKRTIADFCLPFYREMASPKDASTIFLEGKPLTLPDVSFLNAKLAADCRQRATAADSTFVDSLDEQLFDLHFAALRFECFALAWSHHLAKKSGFALVQTNLLYEYLVENEHLDIWAVMRDHYARAVARSVDGGRDPNNPSSKSVVVAHNQERSRVFDEYVALGHPPEVCAHVANQLFTADRAEKIPVYLAFELLRCVGKTTSEDDPTVTPEAIAVVAGTISGMYDDPKARLTLVDIVP